MAELGDTIIKGDLNVLGNISTNGTLTGASDSYTKTEIDTKLNAKANSSNVYTKTETDTKINTKVDSAISSIEIGGRNLARLAYIKEYSNTLNRDGYIFTGYAGAGAGIQFQKSDFNWEFNQYYVLSFKFQNLTEDKDLTEIGGYSFAFSTEAIYINGKLINGSFWPGKHTIPASKDKQTCIVILQCTAPSVDDPNLYIQPQRGNYHSSNDLLVKFWDIKIEKGNKATDWSPAPEDMFNALSDRLNKNELLQTTGQTTTNAMSQKSVTDELNKKANTNNVYTKTEIDTKLGTKQDKLTAGTNITISNNTISAKDTTYAVATSSIDGLMSKADKAKLDSILNLVYPVGSIYMSVNSTNPSILFGGTWIRIANGRTIIGVDEDNGNFNSAKKIGGSFSHDHTNPPTGSHVLTLNEMPERLVARINLTNSTNEQNDNTYSQASGWKNICLADAVSTGNISQVGLGHNHTMGNTGTTTTIPRHFTCYIWQRIAEATETTNEKRAMLYNAVNNTQNQAKDDEFIGSINIATQIISNYDFSDITPVFNINYSYMEGNNVVRTETKQATIIDIGSIANKNGVYSETYNIKLPVDYITDEEHSYKVNYVNGTLGSTTLDNFNVDDYSISEYEIKSIDNISVWTMPTGVTNMKLCVGIDFTIQSPRGIEVPGKHYVNYISPEGIDTTIKVSGGPQSVSDNPVSYGDKKVYETKMVSSFEVPYTQTGVGQKITIKSIYSIINGARTNNYFRDYEIKVDDYIKDVK